MDIWVFRLSLKYNPKINILNTKLSCSKYLFIVTLSVQMNLVVESKIAVPVAIIRNKLIHKNVYSFPIEALLISNAHTYLPTFVYFVNLESAK